jgi:hypothetical protein
MSWDPKKAHRIPGGDVIQRPLALMYQRVFVLTALRAFRAATLSEQILTYFSGLL